MLPYMIETFGFDGEQILGVVSGILVFFFFGKKSQKASSSSSSLLLSSLELSDTNVYEPQIRARLGSASIFFEVVENCTELTPSPLFSELGTDSPVTARFWPWLASPQAYSTPNLCILVCLVVYDSGLVTLEHLLLSRQPSQRGQQI